MARNENQVFDTGDFVRVSDKWWLVEEDVDDFGYFVASNDDGLDVRFHIREVVEVDRKNVR